MKTQLRIYKIADGRLDDFVAAWEAGVRPLREAAGFEIVGAWTVPTSSEFVWIVSHRGDFAAADAAYYASTERVELDPDPAQWIEAADESWARPVS